MRHYSKYFEGIAMKFYEKIKGGKRKNWLHFDGNLGLVGSVNERNTHNICG